MPSPILFSQGLLWCETGLKVTHRTLLCVLCMCVLHTVSSGPFPNSGLINMQTIQYKIVPAMRKNNDFQKYLTHCTLVSTLK